MKTLKEVLLIVVITVFTLIVAPPFLGGIYYSTTGDHTVEQRWLDRAVAYLKVERDLSQDQETIEVLNHTIQRYNHIGAWDVMVFPLTRPAIGVNVPWCPGLTLDPEVLRYPISTGAAVLVHESMHDGWGNLHPFIDAKMRRVGVI